jgi:hypothetical protein
MMSEDNLKPKFEDEFPQESGMTEEGERLYDLGQINAKQAKNIGSVINADVSVETEVSDSQ